MSTSDFPVDYRRYLIIMFYGGLCYNLSSDYNFLNAAK